MFSSCHFSSLLGLITCSPLVTYGIYRVLGMYRLLKAHDIVSRSRYSFLFRLFFEKMEKRCGTLVPHFPDCRCQGMVAWERESDTIQR